MLKTATPLLSMTLWALVLAADMLAGLVGLAREKKDRIKDVIVAVC